MSFFSSSSSSAVLEEAIDPRLALENSWLRDVPMGNVLKILCEFPRIKDAIVAFKDIFFEGETVLPENHKTARYTDARKAFDAIGDVYINNTYNLRRFIQSYNITDQDERTVSTEALILFLPRLHDFYKAVSTFLDAFQKNTSVPHTIDEQEQNNESQEKNNTARIDWYKNLDDAFEKIRKYPIDNILDTDML